MSQLPIRVLCADDHPILREGICALIEREPDIELAAEASNGAEAVASFQRVHPDVVLMDLQMPGMSGMEAIRMIRQLDPAARIVVLTTFVNPSKAAQAYQLGVMGFLSKQEVRFELASTIRAAHTGQPSIQGPLASQIIRHMARDELTVREDQVLQAVAQGLSNKRVAIDLNLAEQTIKFHMKNIMDKLDARDRTHAVVIALKRGILEL